MSRIATWQRAPRDPSTVIGWLFWGGTGASTPAPGAPKPTSEQRRRHLLGAAYLLATVLAFEFSPNYGFLVPFVYVPYKLVDRFLNRKRQGAKPVPVLAEAPPEALWTNACILDRVGRCTGTDQGWLVHCDGWLLFEGERTSFAFTRGEARRLLYRGTGRVRLEDERDVLFTLPGETPNIARLKALMEAWEAAPIPEGEAVLPPTGLHPERWVVQWNIWLAATLTALLFYALMVYLEAWAMVALTFVVALACSATAVRCVTHLGRDLRRFFALDPPDDSPSRLPSSSIVSSDGNRQRT